MNTSEKTKRVLILAGFFPPNTGSAAIRNLKILKNLPDYGWEADLISIRGNQGEKLNSASLDLLKEIPTGMRVHRTKCIIVDQMLGKFRQKFSRRQTPAAATDNPSQTANSSKKAVTEKSGHQKLKDFITDMLTIPDRFVGWLPFALRQATILMKSNSYDVIYAVGKPWTGFFVGYILKKRFMKPLVIDFMDPWISATWVPRKAFLLHKIEQILEKFITSRADFIVVNTNELASDFNKRLQIPKERIGVITCGYDKAAFQGKYARKTSEKFTITHTGTFYKKRDPTNFLLGLKSLIDSGKIPVEDVTINFIGTYSVKTPELLQIMESEPISNVLNSQAWVPQSEAIQSLYQSDVLLLLQPEAKLEIPAKLYEYAYIHKPILVLSAEEGAVANLVRREKWGEVISNDNVEGIEVILYKFYVEFKSGKQNNEFQRQNIEAYEVRNLAKRLGEYLLKVRSN